MSTRSEPRTRVLGGVWPEPPGAARARAWVAPGGFRDGAEEVALVAQAARERLLAVHRGWLRFEDLEDCYSQATLELLSQARRGTLRCSSRLHLRRTLEQRFLSRVLDRRRALGGRSPGQAMLDRALSLGAQGDREVEIVDTRADVEGQTMLRFDLRLLERASRSLSADQRRVLASQTLQVSRAEFCRRFGWSHEKYRKVAQRARARLRRAISEMDASDARCPALRIGSDQGVGTACESISPHT